MSITKTSPLIMQLIYDASLNRLNAVSCWPGGPYDMFILQNCSVGLHFDQTANGDAWLIGEELFFPLQTEWRQN